MKLGLCGIQTLNTFSHSVTVISRDRSQIWGSRSRFYDGKTVSLAHTMPVLPLF